MSDFHKLTLYFPDEIIGELEREAARLDRPLSWVIQLAWKIAAPQLRRTPSVSDVLFDPAPPRK